MKPLPLFSFDIFDTCLVRSCGKPVNVIYALAHEVLGENADFVKVRDFVRKRRQVEAELFQERVEAATIDQIYDKLDYSYYTNTSNEQIKKMEMALETSILVPVASVVKKIEECRKKGKVIFVSDMYFPSSFLRSILDKYDIIKEGEHLYVSCEYQATKSTGRLFDIVKEKEGVSFKEWTHFGDDYRNDYLIPKKKGIRVERIIHENLEYEELCEQLSPYSMDKVSPSIFAGILRATRLSLGIENDGGLLTGVMCGLFLPFVAASLKDAKKKNIKRLYFASRDAYVLFLVAKQFLSLFPEIELKYLYLSTKTVFPLALESGSIEELQFFLKKIYYFKPQSILEMFGFVRKDVEEIGRDIDVKRNCIYGDTNSERFVQLLVSGRYAEIIRKNARIQKELLIGYFKQEGFLSGDHAKIGLVDLGYNGTAQCLLSKIVGNNVMYYYWGASDGNFYAAEMGNYKAFLYTDVNKIIHPKFVESYLCKNLEGTVLGYECQEDGTYIVKHAGFNPLQSEIDDFELRKRVLETASAMYVKYHSLMNKSEELFNSFSCRVIERILKYPSKELASFLAGKAEWDHYVDKQPLIVKLYPHQYFSQKFLPSNDMDWLKRNVYLWRAACFSYTYGRWILSAKEWAGKVLRKLLSKR